MEHKYHDCPKIETKVENPINRIKTLKTNRKYVRA